MRHVRSSLRRHQTRASGCKLRVQCCGLADQSAALPRAGSLARERSDDVRISGARPRSCRDPRRSSIPADHGEDAEKALSARQAVGMILEHAVLDVITARSARSRRRSRRPRHSSPRCPAFGHCDSTAAWNTDPDICCWSSGTGSRITQKDFEAHPSMRRGNSDSITSMSRSRESSTSSCLSTPDPLCPVAAGSCRWESLLRLRLSSKGRLRRARVWSTGRQRGIGLDESEQGIVGEGRLHQDRHEHSGQR